MPALSLAATLAGAGVAVGWAMLTEAPTASLRCLLSAYRSVLFPALIGAEFALACGQLQGFSSLTLHPAEMH